ncbi:hypothetical protein [Aestuariimicrobium ganziense]|uniref:hypothetical protein n=1 Tax=Aestuariimicrobium ganziense TaxID=2773677 RepID=UPI001940C9A0|nr:hypothetical protein [Aestuariimicrobium ganziense]
MASRNKVLFELPFTLEAPRLTNEALGIDRLLQVTSARGKDGSFDREVTLLDAPDHRLMRAGVTLGHRVVDGLGEWYLDAPHWEPWLPADHAEPMGGSGDLPDDLAFLVHPFRRLAPLGPVAAVTQQRVCYLIQGPDDIDLGILRDERITIRRGGIATARFREATLRPSPAMTPAQRAYLVDALVAVGGVQVDSFPAALKRLGAPGQGMTDFPKPRQVDDKAPLEAWVSSLLARRLLDVVRADLALRASELARQARQVDAEQTDERLQARSSSDDEPLTVTPLLDELCALRRQVHALAGVLEPSWREGLEADLDQVVAGGAISIAALPEQYYAVLDQVIAAVRAPQLGDLSRHPARHVLRTQAEGAVGVLATRVHELSVDSSDADWQAALFAARELTQAVQVLDSVGGRRAGKLRKQLKRLTSLLEPAGLDLGVPDDEALTAMGPRAAFEKGIELQRSLDDRRTARERLVRDWPEVRTSLLRLRGRR